MILYPSGTSFCCFYQASQRNYQKQSKFWRGFYLIKSLAYRLPNYTSSITNSCKLRLIIMFHWEGFFSHLEPKSKSQISGFSRLSLYQLVALWFDVHLFVSMCLILMSVRVISFRILYRGVGIESVSFPSFLIT